MDSGAKAQDSVADGGHRQIRIGYVLPFHQRARSPLLRERMAAAGRQIGGARLTSWETAASDSARHLKTYRDSIHANSHTSSDRRRPLRVAASRDGPTSPATASPSICRGQTQEDPERRHQGSLRQWSGRRGSNSPFWISNRPESNGNAGASPRAFIGPPRRP